MDASDLVGAGSEPYVAPFAIEVVGPLYQAVFPGVCIKCGHSSSRTLRLTKLFWCTISDDQPSYYDVSSVEVPVCAACFQTHQHETRPIEASIKGKLLRRWALEALPFVFPLGTSLWFLTILIPLLLHELFPPRSLPAILLIAALCAFFALLASWFYRSIYDKGGQLIIDANDASIAHYAQCETGPLGCRFIVPIEPSSVMRAVDFTRDRSAAFDHERHLFTFENGVVGAKFAEANTDRKWDPTSPPARRAARARWVVLAVIVVIVLYQMLKDFLH